MNDSFRPILIAGPTAAGKSALALALAEAANGCVINADALQVYGCWQVLSARPDATETARAPHHLYGHVPCTTAYSTGLWLAELKQVLQQARQQGQRPIIIGGTGLYFTALTRGLAEIPPVDPEIRNQGNALRQGGQTGDMLDYLQEHDPETLNRIDQRNPVRVQRAWEVHRSSGIGMAAWHKNTPPALVPESSATCLILEADRDWLAERIDRRFDLMLETGAIDEVRAVLKNGWDSTLPALQAIGAAEIAAYLQGNLNRDQLRAQGAAQSRQYAKRQRTWFRNRLKQWQRIPANAAGHSLGKILL
jgi:tRNA dimethylallyltransferase